MSESCKDCFNGCATISFDKCFKYTGDDVDELSICNGDTYNKVTAALIDKILTGTDASSIIPDVDISTCIYIGGQLYDSGNTLNGILQALINSACELKTSVDDINEVIADQYIFDTSCLTLTQSAPSRDDILQATIDKTCSTATSLTTISGDYVKASDLDTLIQQYLDSITSTTVQQNTKMVPYVAYEYYGPLTNFDSGGAGISSAGFTKVYLCNGSNGTPDRRGRVAVGVNIGVPGSTMDSAVNPSTVGNSSITLKGKLGEFKHTLTLAESPAHNHTATAADHFHYLFANVDSDSGIVTSSTYSNRAAGLDGNSSYRIQGNTTNLPSVGKSSSASVSITVGSSGGNQSHNNVQPSIGANFIMFIP